MNKLREKREVERSESLDKTAKIISSLIPLGATAYETYRALVTPLHEKKAKEWQHNVIKRLAKLEKDGKVKLTDLQNDQEFHTIISRATVLILQNHETEKLEALRNVIINSALGYEIDFELKHYFLLFIDQISPLHILLLKIFRNPKIYAREKGIEINEGSSIGGARIYSLFKIEPSLKPKRDLVELAWKDLSDKKLVTTSDLNTIVSGNSTYQPLISDLGESFLDLIAEKEL